MAPRRPTGGKGSNQYARKGTSSALTADDVRSRMDTELAAAAFGSEMASKGTTDTALIQRAAHPEVAERRKVAALKTCPPAVLAVLAEDPDYTICWRVAENPATPPESLRRLVERARTDEFHTSTAGVLMAVARNAAVPPDVARDLVFDLGNVVMRDGAQETVRRLTIENPACPAEILEAVTGSDTPAVAANPSCPRHLQEHIAAQGESYARGCLAEVVTDETIIDTLSQDRDDWVRQRLASNQTCPVPILERLARDPEPKTRGAVAANPGTPVGLLTAMSQDSEPWVRVGVGGNPRTPPSVLLALSRDLHRTVRSVVASNPSSPDEALTRLMRDADGSLVHSAERTLRRNQKRRAK